MKNNSHERVLNKIENHVNVLFRALSKIREIKTNSASREYFAHPNSWEYIIDNIVIDLPNERVREIRNLKPAGKIKSIKLYLRIHCEGCGDTWTYLEKKDYKYVTRNVFDKLNFNVKIIGFPKDEKDEKKEYISGFHVDMITAEDIKEFDENSLVHPLHHAQFGFKDDKTDDFGKMLLLSTPRLIHPPLDLILGIDYILSNFAIDLQRKLHDDTFYFKLLKDYQEIIWKPYFESISSFWNTNTALLSPLQIIPHLHK